MIGDGLLSPGWLTLFALLPLLAILHFKRGQAARAVSTDPTGLPVSLRQRFVSVPAVLAILAFAASVYALARPVERVPLPREYPGIDVMLVLDVSSSMRGLDLDPSQSRLQVATSAAAEFIAERPNDRIGLVRFARYADLRCPPTLDHLALLELLRAEAPMVEDSAEDATGIGAAVALAAEVLAGAHGDSKVIVLLTDGEENVAGSHAPEAIAPLHAGQFCEAAGVRVHAITAGSGRRAQDGSFEPINTTQVESLASRTGGRAWTVRDASALRSVYAAIDRMETAPMPEQRFRIRELHAAWTRLACALALLGGILALGFLRVIPAGDGRPQRVCAGLALLGLAVAAIDPRGAAEERLPAPGESRIIACLDVSRSMLAADLKPSRLEQAQQDLADLAARAVGEQLGLVLFAGEAQLRVPLTLDAASFTRMTQESHPSDLAVGGTDLGAALDRAANALGDQAGVILLLSDGEDRDGRGLLAARRLARQGIQVQVVGYGSERGARIAIPVAGGEDFIRNARGEPVLSRLNSTDLQAIATATGGSYRDAVSGRVPTRFYESGLLRSGRGDDAIAEPTRRPLYGLPLAAALLFAVLMVVWPRRRQR